MLIVHLSHRIRVSSTLPPNFFRAQFSFTGHFVANPATQNERALGRNAKKKNRKYNSVQYLRIPMLTELSIAIL